MLLSVLIKTMADKFSDFVRNFCVVHVLDYFLCNYMLKKYNKFNLYT